MKQVTLEMQNQWRNGAWVAMVGLGLILSACGTSPVRNDSDCDQTPQILESSAPWSGSCTQTTHHDPFDGMEFRHDSPNG